MRVVERFKKRRVAGQDKSSLTGLHIKIRSSHLASLLDPYG